MELLLPISCSDALPVETLERLIQFAKKQGQDPNKLLAEIITRGVDGIGAPSGENRPKTDTQSPHHTAA